MSELAKCNWCRLQAAERVANCKEMKVVKLYRDGGWIDVFMVPKEMKYKYIAQNKLSVEFRSDYLTFSAQRVDMFCRC